MNGEDINKIISEEYADFIIDYRTNPIISQYFPNQTINKIDDAFGTLHLPVSQYKLLTKKGIRLLYLPRLFGLTSITSLESSGINKLRLIPDFNLRGEGVLIGIVDTGINYTLPAFKKQDGTTKIHSIWDQTLQTATTSPINTIFGTEYNKEQINEALSVEDPFTIVPSTDDNGHGTMLAAIAAGTEDSSKGFFGVAPDSELVVVKLKNAKKFLRDFYMIPDEVSCYQENDIMLGVHYCTKIARLIGRPIAICIGIGTSQTGHDGTIALEQQLSLYADFPGVGVVIAAGNEGDLGRHFSGTISPQAGNASVEMNVGEKDKGFSLQLWGDSPGIYSIEIISPSGEYIPMITPSFVQSQKITFIFIPTVIEIMLFMAESKTGDELIIMNFSNAAAGSWKFTIYQRGNLTGRFNLWLPMGDFITKDTYFMQPDNYTTVLSPANAMTPITITAYNPIGNRLFANASRGYSRNNTVKPELAAPGVNYIAPSLKGEYTSYSGTGVASAHTTGIVALLLEWGVVRSSQPNFDTLQIKKYLIRGARRGPNMTYPNRDWGYGILDVYNTFDVLRQNI